VDHRKFDRLTRLFSAPRSRRAALRSLLGTALLGATTRPAAAGPCANGKHECGVKCCPGKCFELVVVGTEVGVCPLCCTGNNIVCKDPETGKSTCCLNKGDDPCDSCALPEDPGSSCRTGITGSYRRR
jgi:hypothetical protein